MHLKMFVISFHSASTEQHILFFKRYFSFHLIVIVRGRQEIWEKNRRYDMQLTSSVGLCLHGMCCNHRAARSL